MDRQHGRLTSHLQGDQQSCLLALVEQRVDAGQARLGCAWADAVSIQDAEQVTEVVVCEGVRAQRFLGKSFLVIFRWLIGSCAG